MKGISKTLKNNYKLLVGILIGLVLSIGSVYAVENIAMIDSEEVSYDNTESHGDYENVQNSIDELYERSGVSTTKWVDPILHGADPVLSGTNQEQSLIPVTIDPDGTVRYANLYTEWYNYSEKRWANAVILVSSPSKEYTTGDVILEQDIESYFVWIPRYKYKIFDTGNYKELIQATSLTNTKDGNAFHLLAGDSHLIDIVFGDKDKVKVEGDTKNGGGSGDTSVNVGDYIVHPAFTLGNTELNGIWVGKFETGYNQDGDNGNPITPEDWTTQGAQVNSEASNHIIVKPNVYSWRNNTVKNFFMSAYEYKKDLKSHMMKNTEWGAVAYLSHSSYGIGGEININNNKTYKTGYSAAPGTDQGKFPGTESDGTDGKSKEWNTPTGFLASTTGNITGVYDMSGGVWEYVAGYRVGSSIVATSGFNETEITNTYKDYIDQYDQSSDATTYNKRILGDATGEMGPFINYIEDNDQTHWHSSWYSDGSYFFEDSYPWFHRGGGWSDGIIAGLFYLNKYTGDMNKDIGFRIVLSTSK